MNHGSSSTGEPSPVSNMPPTRPRKPSIRSSASSRPPLYAATKSTRASILAEQVPLKVVDTVFVQPSAKYNLSDKENLPSGFLRRIEREHVEISATRTACSRRPQHGETPESCCCCQRDGCAAPEHGQGADQSYTIKYCRVIGDEHSGGGLGRRSRGHSVNASK
ncbi:hypothetical protein V8B97DRAFT_1327084 [Scleroderma yunnanense]